MPCVSPRNSEHHRVEAFHAHCSLERDTFFLVFQPGGPDPPSHPVQVTTAPTAMFGRGPMHATAGTAVGNTNAEQAHLIRMCVDDALASFRQEVHRDIHNLHVDLIRQFQIQKVRS